MEFMKICWYPAYKAFHLGQVEISFILVLVPFHLTENFFHNTAILIYTAIIWHGIE